MKKATVFALIVLGMAVANLASADMQIEWVYIDNDPGVSGHEGFTGYMSKYETTNAQYCEFLNDALATHDITLVGNDVMGASGAYAGQLYYDGDGAGWDGDGATDGGAARINYSGGKFGVVGSAFEKHPVTYVSWYGATAFCNYYGYRLPSQWQWQAVADYDGSYIYGCGTTINHSMANYRGSTHPDGTTDVRTFGPYGYGMCDMSGNVWEWTSTASGINYVTRGGAWDCGQEDGSDCKVTDTADYAFPGLAVCGGGFRVIPEPATMLLLGLGGVTLRLRSGQVVWRKRRAENRV